MIALDEKDALTGNLKDSEKLLPLDLVIKLCKAQAVEKFTIAIRKALLL